MLPPVNLSMADEPLPSGPETFSSLALNDLLAPLRSERKHHVLDLGPACGSNIEFFSGFRCKIYVADLFDALVPQSSDAPEPGRVRPRLFDRQPLIGSRTHVDIVLAWDVLNYLKANALLDLFGQLRQFCGQGTMLHALIWGRNEIPAAPMRFRITDDRHVTFDVSSPVTRTNPRYAPREMERLMAGFRVCRSYLLRNGMQEYVFSLDRADPPM